MNLNKLNKNGYTTIKVKKEIIDELKKDILNILYKKIFNKKIKLKNKLLDQYFKKLNNTINNLDQDVFLQKFGDVSLRYCNYRTGKIFNTWIVGKAKKNLNFKHFSIPYPMKYQLKENKKIKRYQYCIYFRCVRSKKKDVGYIHRDIDFWNIGEPILPKSVKNFNKLFKIWIPVFGCNQRNSLKLLKNSQNYDFNIKYVKKKFLKPIINKKEADLFKKISPIRNFSNEVVMFDYNTAHFAPMNQSKYYRVSAEFTLICK